ncbi:ER protein Pkr1 [Colletotrichum graminicola]|uniref:ER protein Pkr1 n=1 Tax=Colletotrichum graminicola (strain M1.001 / M2 / FGSC 10212) TaxID=645133 RepID=E3QEJ6_COLGM|nr:ER protein Pkr1 [Colletotrichum graminicola M1.001]EFQ29302.1 ER protein Pkr1 [Colletotrichum graminicola M1.001]WDK13739.1 ER protein Pkr1 [Colletotrichum graminicola]
MASFITNLWESIFVPGPTPTLVRAANGAFASLQVLLTILLLATWSIHFVILSFLSGSLWFAINWFVNELAVHAEQEARKAEASSSGVGGAGNIQTTDDSDTEVEGVAGGRVGVGKKGAAVGSSQVETPEQQRAADLKRRTAAAAAAAAVAAESGPEDATNGGTQSSVSTEDEWEKVSGNENEKDK